MIKIIDYGLGNIRAFQNVYYRANINVGVAKNADDLEDAERLILPGVGSFDHAIDLLNESGMREALDHLVLVKKIPILGICVGMQILADGSDEGQREGLGWIPGRVRKFEFDSHSNAQAYLPHMGWNDVMPATGSNLFKELEEEARFYFLHSYYFDCSDKKDSIATSKYGFEFCSAVSHENVFGVQFHPEKSHDFGMALLKNFANSEIC